MSVNPKVIEYTELGDIVAVREVLSKMAYSDNSLAHIQFKDSLNYVKKKLGEEVLYDSHDHEFSLIYDSEKYLTIKDYKASVSNLIENFSERRVKDVLNIAEVVFKTSSEKEITHSVEKKETQSAKKLVSHRQEAPHKQTDALKKKILIGVLIVGVAVMATIWLFNK